MADHPWMDSFKRFLKTLSPEEAMNPTRYEAAFKAGWEAAKNPAPTPTVNITNVFNEITSAAKVWQDDHERRWGGKDQHMVDVGKSDARDLHYIASMVKEGKFKEARRAAGNLDTIVREELPKSFFLLLKEYGVSW